MRQASLPVNIHPWLIIWFSNHYEKKPDPPRQHVCGSGGQRPEQYQGKCLEIIIHLTA